MLEKKRIQRIAVTAFTIFALVGAAPQTATAEIDNLFTLWAEEVTDRSMVEVPFAVIVSLPALIISAPFWFGVWSIDQIKMRTAEENTFDYSDDFADKRAGEGSDVDEAAAGESTDEASPSGEASEDASDDEAAEETSGEDAPDDEAAETTSGE